MRSSSNGTGSSTKSNRTHSYVATPALLRATSQALEHQIYWAGPRANVAYELTVTRGGFVYVSYLTAGAKVGDPRPDFVTIGTAPVARGAERIVRTGLIAPVR
jgi:hypothetical protein